MVGSLRFAAAAACSMLLTACASSPDGTTYTTYASPDTSLSPPTPVTWDRGTQVETPDRPMQCVPYARAHSGIDLHGDAGSWWDLAAGRYARSSDPQLGSVLVLTGYAGPHRGHVAVVSAIDSPRQIRIDHANWLNDGKVYRNDPVVDVSPDNDWSEVRVWDERDQVLGVRTYLVRGFIGPASQDDSARVASRD
jgi:surface antigen